MLFEGVITNGTMIVLAAIGFGIGTTILPWIVMYPSMCFGWFGRNIPRIGFRIMPMNIYGHAVFGFGLTLWTLLLLRPF